MSGADDVQLRRCFWELLRAVRVVFKPPARERPLEIEKYERGLVSALEQVREHHMGEAREKARKNTGGWAK